MTKRTYTGEVDLKLLQDFNAAAIAMFDINTLALLTVAAVNAQGPPGSP